MSLYGMQIEMVIAEGLRWVEGISGNVLVGPGSPKGYIVPCYPQGCQFRFPYGGGQRSDGGGLARDSRQNRELKKLGFQMLKKRLFVKENH